MNERAYHSRAMMWLRARARGGATFALLAMVLQICCTFGHVHFSESSGFQIFKSVTVARAVAAPVAFASEFAPSEADTLPPGSDGDPLCPLCLIGNLVGAAVVASPPGFALPVAYAYLDLPRLAAEHSGLDIIRTSFWSRGPPLS